MPKLADAPPGNNVVSDAAWNELVREVRRLGRWRAQGGEIKSEPGGMLLNVTPPVGSVALVTGTGNESGGGKYTGVICARPATGAGATGTLSAAEVGTDGSTVIRIINVREQGQATHDLVWDGSQLPLRFLGIFQGTAADGVAVYAIDGFQWKDCA